MLKKLLEKLSVKELALYVTSIVIAILGFVFLIIGVVADNLGVDNPLYQMQAAFPWRYIGFILIGVAVIFAIIVLCAFAKKTDRISDREMRRKQRLSAMMSDIEKQEEIVVSDGKIVEDHKKVEETQEEPVETKPIESTEPPHEEAKIDQPVEQPKVEEPKVEQPTEQPKVEEPKAEEPKVDNPNNNNPSGAN